MSFTQKPHSTKWSPSLHFSFWKNCHFRHIASLLRPQFSYCVALVSCNRIRFHCTWDSSLKWSQSNLPIWWWTNPTHLCTRTSQLQPVTMKKENISAFKLTALFPRHFSSIASTYATDRIFIHGQSRNSLGFAQCPCDDSAALRLRANIRITNRHLNDRTVAVDLDVLHSSAWDGRLVIVAYIGSALERCNDRYRYCPRVLSSDCNRSRCCWSRWSR